MPSDASHAIESAWWCIKTHCRRWVIEPEEVKKEEAGKPTAAPAAFGQAVGKAWKEISDPFVQTARAPRALWGLYISYFLEGAAYFGILTELMLFLQENVGISPHYAGIVVGFFTCGITLSQLFLGGVADKIGVRRAMWMAVGLLTFGRVVLAAGELFFHAGGLGSGLFFITIAALLLVAVAYGMYQPAAYAAVKQFTDEKSAAMGYAMIYGLMNLGAFFIGLASPYIRKSFATELPPNGLDAVFWACAAAVAVGSIVVFSMITKKSVKAATVEKQAKPLQDKEGKAASELEKPVDVDPRLWDLPFIFFFVLALVGTAVLVDLAVDEPLGRWLGFLHSGSRSGDLLLRIAVFGLLLGPALVLFMKRRPDHPFRNKRFVFFIFILIPVQTLFAHNWLTLPQYIKYAYSGFVSDKYELISNINPVLIFFLAPLVAAVTARANVYKMMVWGTLVMAAPTFLLAMAARPYLLYTYIFLMTIGEAMWQPRFLQYIAEIAPEGKTGIYMGIGQFPWFLTKMITGFYAGWFLARYCPAEGIKHTESMWLIYACIAMVSPIVLWLVRKWAGAGKGMGTPGAA